MSELGLAVRILTASCLLFGLSFEKKRQATSPRLEKSLTESTISSPVSVQLFELVTMSSIDLSSSILRNTLIEYDTQNSQMSPRTPTLPSSSKLSAQT